MKQNKNNNITNDFLYFLKDYNFLYNLDLSNCNNITDEGLKYLENTTIKHLNLSNCSNITDEGIKYLKTSEMISLNLENTMINK